MQSPKSPSKPQRKSISPRKTTPLKQSPSSQKIAKQPAVPKPALEQGFSSKTKNNRLKLSEAIDTFNLLIRSKNPIRCLQHNSNISIYCQTQQKLLCANCIFGRNQHKFHRVTPIDRSYDKIEKDIQTMNRLIAREIENMRKTNEKLFDNMIQEENDAHTSLTSLVELYEDCHRKLEDCFITSKTKIIEKLQKIRHRYQNQILELKLQMDNYSSTNLLKSVNQQYFKKQQILLYEHAVSSAISTQRRFQEKDWIKTHKEIVSLSQGEKKKVMAIREMINRMSSAQ